MIAALTTLWALPSVVLTRAATCAASALDVVDEALSLARKARCRRPLQD